MSTKGERREELRRERLEAERTETAAARRRQIVGYGVAGLLSAAVLAGIVAVVISADGEGGGSEGPFGTHFEGLAERREAAAVPTMAEGGGEHFHPELIVCAKRERITVPANIGIDPEASTSFMAGLHTHDETGTIHNEAGTGSTLGQFFAVWGVEFSKDRLGPYRATASNPIRLWVDGKPSTAYENLELADGQQIVIVYGPKDAPPPPEVADG